MNNLVRIRKYFKLVALLATITKVQAEVIPTDPYYSYQWALQKMEFPEAWNYSLGNPAVKIGVLDSGIVFGTPDLQNNFQSPISALSNGLPDASALNTFPQIHGTWVASTIGMGINNGIGGAGTGDFTILPVRITDDNGSATDQTIEQGIELAVSMGCRVINISYLASNYDEINQRVEQLLKANQAAGRKDFMVFMSAGNTNKERTVGSADLDNAALRISSDHLIMVAGTDEIDQRWVSDTFVGSDVGPFVDLSAPASNILVANGTNSAPYGLANGTSFSSAFAASVAALAFSINPNLTADQVLNLMEDTAFNPLGTPGWNENFGWGRINAQLVASDANSTLLVPDPEIAPLVGIAFSLMIMIRRF